MVVLLLLLLLLLLQSLLFTSKQINNNVIFSVYKCQKKEMIKSVTIFLLNDHTP